MLGNMVEKGENPPSVGLKAKKKGMTQWAPQVHNLALCKNVFWNGRSVICSENRSWKRVPLHFLAFSLMLSWGIISREVLQSNQPEGAEGNAFLYFYASVASPVHWVNEWLPWESVWAHETGCNMNLDPVILDYLVGSVSCAADRNIGCFYSGTVTQPLVRIEKLPVCE
jgi:hypothetical protein